MCLLELPDARVLTCDQQHLHGAQVCARRHVDRHKPFSTTFIPATQIKAFRQEHGATLQEAMARCAQTALAEYERITGFRENDVNVVWHHRLSEYGPACRRCGKPLRTPAAKHCAACGSFVED